MAVLKPERALAIVNRLIELTDQGKLEWTVFEFDDEELEARREKFKYYVAYAGWRDAPYRLQVWKIGAGADGKSVQVEELDSSMDKLGGPLRKLFELATEKKSEQAEEELASDILDDLD